MQLNSACFVLLSVILHFVIDLLDGVILRVASRNSHNPLYNILSYEDDE